MYSWLTKEKRKWDQEKQAQFRGAWFDCFQSDLLAVVSSRFPQWRVVLLRSASLPSNHWAIPMPAANDPEKLFIPDNNNGWIWQFPAVHGCWTALHRFKREYSEEASNCLFYSLDWSFRVDWICHLCQSGFRPGGTGRCVNRKIIQSWSRIEHEGKYRTWINFL